MFQIINLQKFVSPLTDALLPVNENIGKGTGIGMLTIEVVG